MKENFTIVNQAGSSSGATHVPNRTSSLLSPRTLPRCGSGLPRDTLNGTGTAGNVYERPLAQEGLSSTIFKNSKNLVSSSQGLRPDITETVKTTPHKTRFRSVNNYKEFTYR